MRPENRRSSRDDAGGAEDDFIIDDEADGEGSTAAPDDEDGVWAVLIVDDEPAVHDATRMAARDLRYAGRRLEFVSALSAAAAKEAFRQRDDIALVLLDVVMESEDAGLRLARWIREDLGDRNVRIILRTGQPGQAPERDVILNYDINDYKEKTDLTVEKLTSAMIAALRSYDQIATMDYTRRSLRKIIASSTEINDAISLRSLAGGVVSQIGLLVDGVEHAAIVVDLAQPWGDAKFAARIALGDDKEIGVLTGTGRFAPLADEGDIAGAARLLEPIAQALVAPASSVAHRQDDEGLEVFALQTANGRRIVLAMGREQPLSPLDAELVKLYCLKVAAGFENLALFNQLRATHEATVLLLAKIAEHRDQTTGDHIRRVSDMSAEITSKLCERGAAGWSMPHRMRLSSMLHDIGKIATPDAILNKPGKLTDVEWVEMKRHTDVGGHILEQAKAMHEHEDFFGLAAEIARHHHERFDGGGYPDGLSGEAIPLGARILAVADVFDALTHARSYKDAWPAEEAQRLIRDGAGRQFDPQIVDAFEAVMAERAAEVR